MYFRRPDIAPGRKTAYVDRRGRNIREIYLHHILQNLHWPTYLEIWKQPVKVRTNLDDNVMSRRFEVDNIQTKCLHTEQLRSDLLFVS
jgi:hypothetical protein